MSPLEIALIGSYAIMALLFAGSFLMDNTNGTRESFSTAGFYRLWALIFFLAGIICTITYGQIHRERREDQREREECVGAGILYDKTTEYDNGVCYVVVDGERTRIP
jgi:hypothetical protein